MSDTTKHIKGLFSKADADHFALEEEVLIKIEDLEKDNTAYAETIEHLENKVVEQRELKDINAETIKELEEKVKYRDAIIRSKDDELALLRDALKGYKDYTAQPNLNHKDILEYAEKMMLRLDFEL